MNERLEAALDYATKYGIPVFPAYEPRDGGCSCPQGEDCESPGKHPRTPNGFHDATTDPDRIRTWWQRWPEANVGVVGGDALMILDLDGEAGMDALKDLVTFSRSLPIVRTGRGIHIWFKGGPWKREIKRFPDVDVLGHNGFGIAPPSVHPSGRPYEWIQAPNGQLPEAPDGLRTALDQPRRSPIRRVAADPDALIPKGGQHLTLLSLAGSMRRSGMTRDAIFSALKVQRDQRGERPQDIPDGELADIAEYVAEFPPKDIPATMAGPLPDLAIQRFSEIEPREVAWMWEDRIPTSALTLVVGDGGVGKGQILADIAARVSRGRHFPDDPRAQAPGRVLWVGTEDSYDRVVVPRLAAAGGDDDNVYAVKITPGEWFSLPARVPWLVSVVTEGEGFDLVILDSVTGFLDDGMKSTNDQDVRRAIGPLALLAEDTDTTVVCSMHVTKNAELGAGHRVMGSVAWRNLARAVLVAGFVAGDPDPEQRGLALEKSNYGGRADTLGYHITTKPVPMKSSGLQMVKEVECVEWDTEPLDEVSADDLMPRKRGRGRPADTRVEAESFLLGELADGPVSKDRLIKAAREGGISERTLHRARKALEVVTETHGPHGSVWRLAPVMNHQ